MSYGSGYAQAAQESLNVGIALPYPAEAMMIREKNRYEAMTNQRQYALGEADVVRTNGQSRVQELGHQLSLLHDVFESLEQRLDRAGVVVPVPKGLNANKTSAPMPAQSQVSNMLSEYINSIEVLRSRVADLRESIDF